MNEEILTNKQLAFTVEQLKKLVEMPETKDLIKEIDLGFTIQEYSFCLILTKEGLIKRKTAILYGDEKIIPNLKSLGEIVDFFSLSSKKLIKIQQKLKED